MNIVFVLFENVTQLDFTGPVQFLSRLPGAKVHVVSKDGAAVKTDCGFSILPRSGFAQCPQADVLCVPGGHGVRDAIADQVIVDFVRQQANGAGYITSACTGTFILGAAGLLQGKKATCHWAYPHLLPLFGAMHQPTRVVRDGNLITAGGVTSGIDFALELIAAISGEDVARTIQLALEYDPAPPFGGGSLAHSKEETVRRLRADVYDQAAAEMEIAIKAIF
ncbi:DJ-1/PfpI family protein [Sphingorhabdus sp.]|uniref:DJ-1/PfpI family protein n=1 Tax=Sphingorhabdus sp. TaxID=1902408 RepID=UPI0033428D1A